MKGLVPFKNKPYCLFVSTFFLPLVPEKNLHHLVEAFASMKDEGLMMKDYKLVLAGDVIIEADGQKLT